MGRDKGGMYFDLGGADMTIVLMGAHGTVCRKGQFDCVSVTLDRKYSSTVVTVPACVHLPHQDSSKVHLPHARNLGGPEDAADRIHRGGRCQSKDSKITPDSDEE